MKLELDLKKDGELRKYIRGIILEQVKGITREEFSEIVKAEISRKLEGFRISNYNNYVTNLVYDVVTKELIGSGFKEQLKNKEAIIEKMVKRLINDHHIDQKIREGISTAIAELATKLISKVKL